MKNLNKRTKTLLAIAGVVVVVVIAGLVLLGPGNVLFGATNLVITPSNPTVILHRSLQLNVNAVEACNWITSDATVVAIASNPTEQHSIVVDGLVGNGKATITAKCGWAFFNVNHVSTVVTVVPY